jgi:dihydrodiol dehydrogenase / D-xylose 1-dehydrogenase (NADP)
MMPLEAGRPVPVEKPFTINAEEAGAMTSAARDRRLFLMETMWTRFLPLYVHFRELSADGVLGRVVLLSADFGIRPDRARARLFNRALGGGALLDLGI